MQPKNKVVPNQARGQGNQPRRAGAWLVPVRAVDAIVEGEQSKVYKFDLARAPVPARRFVADAAWLSPHGSMVRLGFAQAGINGQVVSAIVVTMPPDAIRRVADAFIDGFQDKMNSFLESIGATEVPSNALSARNSDIHTAAVLKSNAVAVHQNRYEATLDFYEIQFVDETVIRDKLLEVETVARVDLPTTVLAGLVQSIVSYSQAHLGKVTI